MTRAGLVKRVERWRRLLAPEWRVTLVDELPEDPGYPVNAQVAADDDYLHARLWLNPDRYAPATPLGELDVTIVHELVHLLLRELRRTIDLLDGQVHRDVHRLLEERFRHEEELLVERVARVVARLEHPDGLLVGTVDASDD